MTHKTKIVFLLNDYKICDAKSDDIIELLKIEKRCFKIGDRFKYHQFWYLINKGIGIFRVIRFNNVCCGYFYLGSTKNSLPKLYSIAIDPSYQRIGMGRTALYWLLCLCSELRYESLRIEVRIDNHKAIKFYRKLGFKKYGRKIGYYMDGSDAILMKRNLQCQMMDS